MKSSVFLILFSVANASSQNYSQSPQHKNDDSFAINFSKLPMCSDSSTQYSISVFCSFYVFYHKTDLKISKSGCYCICQSANIIISNIEILIGNTISKLNFHFLIKTLILPVCSEPTAYTPCNARAPKYCILLKANAKVLCMSGFGNVSTRKPTVGFIRGLDNLFGSLLYWGKKLV